MESQAKVLADLMAAISSMKAKLDDMHPVFLELNQCRPGVDRAVDALQAEVGDLRDPVVDATHPAEPAVGTDVPPLLLLSAGAPSSLSKPSSAPKPASAAAANACIDVCTRSSPLDTNGCVAEVPAQACSSPDKDAFTPSMGVTTMEMLREGAPESAPLSATTLQGSSLSVSISNETVGVDPAACTGFITTMPITYSTVCLPQDPVAAPVLLASSPPTMTESSASRRDTSKFHVHRPMPWPSFLAVHAYGDETRPLPWPSFRIIYSCESPSDAIIKPSRQCMSHYSPTIIRDVIEFHISVLSASRKVMDDRIIQALSDSTFMKPFAATLTQCMERNLNVTSPLAHSKLLRSDFCGNLCASTGCIIIPDLCNSREWRCLNDFLLFLEYRGSASDCVQSVYTNQTTLVWLPCTISGFHLLVMVRSLELKLLSNGSTTVTLLIVLLDSAKFAALSCEHLGVNTIICISSWLFAGCLLVVCQESKVQYSTDCYIARESVSGLLSTMDWHLSDFSCRSAVTVWLSCSQEPDHYFCSSQLTESLILICTSYLLKWTQFDTISKDGFSRMANAQEVLSQVLIDDSFRQRPTCKRLSYTAVESNTFDAFHCGGENYAREQLCNKKICVAFSPGLIHEEGLARYLSSACALASVMYNLIEASFHMCDPSMHWHEDGESWGSAELIGWLITNLFDDCFLSNMYDSDIPSINRLNQTSKATFQVATASILYEAMLELKQTSSGTCACLHELQMAGSGTESTCLVTSYSVMRQYLHTQCTVQASLVQVKFQSGWARCWSSTTGFFMMELHSDMSSHGIKAGHIWVVEQVREGMHPFMFKSKDSFSILDTSHASQHGLFLSWQGHLYHLSSWIPVGCVKNTLRHKLTPGGATLATWLCAPWDPGGCILRGIHDSGLRTSRMLRRGECYEPCGLLHRVAWAAVSGLQAQGPWAERSKQQLYLKWMEAKGDDIEELEPEPENPGKGGQTLFPIPLFLYFPNPLNSCTESLVSCRIE